jgi:hypothetical protein
VAAALIVASLTSQTATAAPHASAAYGQLPLTFESNLGQTDQRVRFLARGHRYSLFLTATEAVLSLSAGECVPAVVRMSLAGANAHPQLAGLDRQPGLSHYFIGDDPARWQRNVPSYASVRYAAVYPGIDLIYHGNNRQLEYDFAVAPGADPKRIAFTFDGVRKISVDADGNLVLATSGGDIVQHRPLVYQDIDGQRVSVDGAYRLLGEHRVGFQVASYDRSRALIIDPVLVYATYLGGSSNDIARAIAVDGSGGVYVTGETNSVNFPSASSSSVQPATAGSTDVFVAKLNAAGSALVYSTYLGGSGGDSGYAIAVDSGGNAYVTGETNSPTAAATGNIPFPRVGAFQTNYNGGGDAFFTKLSADGSAIVYSTYLGGTGVERGYGVAVDSVGAAYFTGFTNSVNFPTVFPFQGVNGGGGNYDAFVVKLNAAGSAMVYSTYLGGNASEYSIDGGAIAVDGSGNAYVAGTTASTNFPGASASTIQPANGGGFNDGFVVKLNTDGNAIVYSSYLGGSGYDAVNGIALDAQANAYVTGYTDSPNFPTVSPIQATRNGFGDDAFVAKVNAAGSALVYSTYLGGSGSDIAYDIAVDSRGRAFVSGSTSSSNFPTAGAIQPYFSAPAIFVSELNPAGSALLFSTYYGGSNGSQHGYGIAFDTIGNAYVTGDTSATNFPTTAAFQPAYAGSGTDAFILKIFVGVEPAPPTGVTATAQPASNVLVTWNAVAGATSYEVLRGCAGALPFLFNVGSATTFNDVSASTNAAYVYRVRAVNATGESLDSSPDLATTVTFTDDPITAPQVVKAVHLQELQTAVNAVRVCGALFAFVYQAQDAPLAGSVIRSLHVTTLRNMLDEGLAALTLPLSGYTDVVAAGVNIRGIHIQEIRTKVK